MAGLRLWHAVLATRPPRDDVETIIECAKGRLGKIALCAFRWGVSVAWDGFLIPSRKIPTREPWFIAQKVLLAHLKRQQCLRLALRRPLLFGGLEAYNVKQHLALLRILSPLDSAVIMKLWSGSAMCAYKRAQIYHESASCACGAEQQTVSHLLWHCPLQPPAPMHIIYLQHLPPFRSVSHLLPLHAEQRDIRDWRERELSESYPNIERCKA